MRSILLAVLLFAIPAFPQTANVQMTLPKVETKTEKRVTEDLVITRKCPEGYEAHFVDKHDGFDADSSYYGLLGGGEPVYAVCFEKSFMDELKKHKELLMNKPQLRPV